jgi:hypothetical protein
VALTVEMTSALPDVFAGVGVSTADGTPIAFSYSNERRQHAWPLAPGWYRIEVDLDVTLLPRQYVLDAFICRTDGREIDSVDRVRELSVLSVSERGDDGYPWPRPQGFVRPNASWRAPRAVEGAPALIAQKG